jgi:hypothetical protein
MTNRPEGGGQHQGRLFKAYPAASESALIARWLLQRLVRCANVEVGAHQQLRTVFVHQVTAQFCQHSHQIVHWHKEA